MASTYVNNLRLNEMGTGDASGTWGTTTNTNLELIGEALGFGTEAITTNADTHTTTVADGASDAGRAMYLKYTGTLDSACTITIAPNTMKRMQFIENATSGSQNIIISQGSGANVTIPAGDVKAVYLDGAGSGAAVTDAFASLNVVDLKVEDDLTVTDDLIVNGDIDLEGSIDVNGTANLDVVDIDGAVDMASTLQVDGAITSSAGATITVADNSDNLTLTSTDADANAGPNLRMYRNSGSPADNDYIGEIQFEGRNDNSQDVVYAGLAARILDASDGTEDGRFELFTVRDGSQISTMVTTDTELIFNNDSIDFDFRVESNGNANMLFVDGGNDNVGIGVQPTGVLDVKSDGGDDSINLVHSGNTVNIVSIGQSSDNSGNGVIQLRRNNGTVHSQIHSHGNSYFNGGSIGVGFASGTPDSLLHVDSSYSGTLVTFHQTAGASGDDRGLDVETSSTGTTVQRWLNSGSELMRVAGNGNVGIGTTSLSSLLTVAGQVTATAGAVSAPTYSFIGDTSTGFSRPSGSQLNFVGGGTERARINSAGGLSIGTADVFDATCLSLVGTHTNDNVGLMIVRSAGDDESACAAAFVKASASTSTSNILIRFGINSYNSGAGMITVSGATGAFGSFSDVRLKENIEDLPPQLDNIMALRPVSFDYKEEKWGQKDQIGFVAQEVEEVYPDLVGENEGYKITANVNKMEARLIKAIQEQQEQIEQLKTQIKTLQ